MKKNTPWTPSSEYPGYESRLNENGHRELRPITEESTLQAEFSSPELFFIKEAVTHYVKGEDVNSSPLILSVMEKLGIPRE